MHSAPTWPSLSAQAVRPAPVPRTLRAPRPASPAQHPVPCHSALLLARLAMSRYNLTSCSTACHNTLGVLQYTSLPFKQLQSRYNVCIVIQPAFLANLPLLQYNCHPTSYIAIHLSPRLQYNSNPLHTKLQYNPSYCKILPALQAPIAVTIQYLYCDTIPMLKWVVAHSFTAQKFFFSLLFFFLHLFQPLEKNIYIYIHLYFFFIFHNTQINL